MDAVALAREEEAVPGRDAAAGQPGGPRCALEAAVAPRFSIVENRSLVVVHAVADADRASFARSGHRHGLPVALPAAPAGLGLEAAVDVAAQKRGAETGRIGARNVLRRHAEVDELRRLRPGGGGESREARDERGCKERSLHRLSLT